MSFGVPRIRHFKSRLTIAAVVPAASAFLFASIVLVLLNRHIEQSEQAQRGQSIVASAATAVTVPLAIGNLEVLSKTITQLRATDPAINVIAVCSPDGKVIASTERSLRSCEALPFRTEVAVPSANFANYADTESLHGVEDAKANTVQTKFGVVAVELRTGAIAGAGFFVLGALVLFLAFATILSGMFALRLQTPLIAALNDITNCLHAIGAGTYELQDPSSAVRIDDDLRNAQCAVRKAAELLREREILNQQHIEQLEEAAQTEREKNRRIAALLRSIEGDRRRTSSDIHDHVGASLATVMIWVRRLGVLVQAGAAGGESESHSEILAAIRKLESSVNDAYDAARNIVRKLRPEMLDVLGLDEALAELVGNFVSNSPRCEYRYECPQRLPQIEREVAISIYRVVQESLTNAAKYSNAAHVVVRLVCEGDDVLRLTVVDDGTGFDVRAVASEKTFGLIGMRERMTAIGGRLTISSSAGGTTVEAQVRASGSEG